LASDESNATTGKRLATVGVDNTETNRRDWRELLYSAPGLGSYISGCIMFDETFYQKAADGTPFVDVLKKQGIVPGIKVDTGLQVGRPLHVPGSTPGNNNAMSRWIFSGFSMLIRKHALCDSMRRH
jgi:fructose-bisphosphate aldolase class 1